jgi:allantoicase
MIVAPAVSYFYSRGAPGELSEIEIDTLHFLGNFPESCEVHALNGSEHHDWETSVPSESEWTLVLPRTKLSAHKQHYFELENVEGKVYTHVKVTIHPDGGMKRVRVIGKKVDEATSSTPIVGVPSAVPSSSATSSPTAQHSQNVITIPVLPLTAEEFAPFGQVIQATSSTSTPSSVKVTAANAGTAEKFHKISLLSSGYPSESGETTGISIYRCQPLEDISEGVTVLKTLERHLFTSQAFIPMGKGAGEGLSDPSDSYLIVVAHNGNDDKPNMETLKAFVATTAQGISYDAGTWRMFSCRFNSLKHLLTAFVRPTDDGAAQAPGSCLCRNSDRRWQRVGLRDSRPRPELHIHPKTRLLHVERAP